MHARMELITVIGVAVNTIGIHIIQYEPKRVPRGMYVAAPSPPPPSPPPPDPRTSDVFPPPNLG